MLQRSALRRMVVAALPRRVKVLLRRLRRRIAPAGSPARTAPVPVPRPATRAPKPPARRVFDIALPRVGDNGLPDAADQSAGAGQPPVLHVDVPASCYIAKQLEQGGLDGYERNAVESFLAALELAGPGAVLDVGANIGIYGLLAARYSARPVHAFEPVPTLAAATRGVAAANGLDLAMNEIALGRETGSATLYLSAVTDASNSLNEAFRQHTGTLTVPVERLDDYVARTGIVPAIIKIDTETTEPDVLAGGAETIRTHRPWLFVEVLFGRTETQLAEEIAPHGYTFYHLDAPGRLEPCDTIVGEGSDSSGYMYLFVPEPLDEEFWTLRSRWRTALDDAARTGQVDLTPATVTA